jgi:hypothetical protein
MTKRSIDKNWKKLLADGVVTHKKKKVGPIDYEKKTKNGKKTIWFDVDKDVLEASRISSKEALVPDKSKAGNYSKLAALGKFEPIFLVRKINFLRGLRFKGWSSGIGFLSDWVDFFSTQKTPIPGDIP